MARAANRHGQIGGKVVRGYARAFVTPDIPVQSNPA